MKLYEDLTGTRRVSQDIQVSGVAGDTFVLSGWAIGHFADELGGIGRSLS